MTERVIVPPPTRETSTVATTLATQPVMLLKPLASPNTTSVENGSRAAARLIDSGPGKIVRVAVVLLVLPVLAILPVLAVLAAAGPASRVHSTTSAATVPTYALPADVVMVLLPPLAGTHDPGR